MTKSELINEIISEWAYRVDDGQPNPKNPKHMAELSIVLSEMGLSDIKQELFKNIEEDDKQFTNPILNKEIPYKAADGSTKKGIVGNLLRLPKDSEGRKAAEKLMPPEGSPERDSAMQDLGSEKDGKSTGGDKEKGKEDAKGKEGEGEKGGGEEEKAKAAQAMFDPKADPAMGARLDREKAANDKLANKEKDSEAENDKKVGDDNKPNEKKPEVEFSEPTNPPPQNEKGVEKDGKIAGTTIETEPKLDEIDPKFLKEKSTQMNKYYEHFKEDKKKAEGEAMAKFGYTSEQVKDLKDDSKKEFEDEVKKHQEPTYNLCKVSLPNSNLFCAGNKGIPRKDMPQFKGEPKEGTQAWDVLQKAKEKDPTATEADGEPYFRQMLADKGIKVTDAEVPSESLKATQTELVGDKVLGMKSVLDAGPSHPAYKKMTAPLYVSKDGYVVDGHHRWAAITAYNMEHPDNPLPLKVMIIDQPIDDAIKTSNEFASEFGVAAKSGKQAGPAAGPNSEPPANEPSRPNTNPTEDKSSIKSMKGESKTIKGKKSGKEIKTIDLEGGAQVYGVQHRDTKMVDDIIDNIKSTIPQEKWKDIVFLGEGGASDENGELEFHDEAVHAADEFKKMGAGIDSWDGDDLDVHNDQSKLYKKQKEKTGLNDNQVKAGNWASMIGQGEGTDTMNPNDYLDEDGKQFLQDAAKEAGLPQIENWENPTGEVPNEENPKGSGDKGTLYRLSFPEDNGDKETKINNIQVAFNETRDENILEKTKELQAKGKIPISIAGEGHVDLVNNMMKNENSQYMNEISVRFAKLIKEVVDEIVSESMLLMEVNFPPGPKGTFWVRNKVSKKVYLVKEPKDAVHEKPSPKQIEKAAGELKTKLKAAGVQNKKVSKPAVNKLGKGDFRDNPKEKNIENPSTESSASELELKYQNENAVTQMQSRDGKAQTRWMNGEETAPGTDAGAFNEVFGMTSAAIIRRNPNITDAQLEKILRAKADKGSVTKDLKVSGGDKMTAAIQTGRAINQRTSEIAEEEGYDPKTLTQTGYWGSASSKASAIAQLAEMVKKNPKIRFNGLTFDEYKQIILTGGGGEDPTDTMIVMHDGKSNNVAILHVSNKIGSNNIQANSTVKFTYIRAINILDEIQVSGKDKEQSKNIVREHAAKGITLQKEQKKYINSFLGEFAKKGAQNPEEFAKDIYADKADGGKIRRGEEVDGAFKKSGAIGKACKGGTTKNKETGKTTTREPFKPEGTDACSLVDNPNATPEQKALALFQYYYALGETDRTDIETPSFVREIIARSQDVKGEDGNAKYNMGYDEKKVNELYGKMADELEAMRQDLNKVVPNLGDRVLAQDIVERLHLGITEEDHLKNGIPSNRFMLVMGNNEADIWYDKDGQAYEKKNNQYYKVLDDGTNDKNPTALRQKEVNRGNIATIGNADNFKNCLGVPKGQHVRQTINVKYEPVNLETGIINAHVFDVNGKEKATLIIRTKTGPGGDANDTVQFSKDMQNCMQKQEYLKKKRKNKK